LLASSSSLRDPGCVKTYTAKVEILCRRGGRGDTVSVRPTTKT
jgi:hypothetical protein